LTISNSFNSTPYPSRKWLPTSSTSVVRIIDEGHDQYTKYCLEVFIGLQMD